MRAFTSFLRLSYENCVDDESFLGVIAAIKKYKIKEVTFFTDYSHAVVNYEITGKFCNAFRKRLPIFHKIGVKAGINVHSTTGYFMQGESIMLKNCAFAVGEDGNERPGSLCSSSVATRNHITKLYTMIARLHPDFSMWMTI